MVVHYNFQPRYFSMQAAVKTFESQNVPAFINDMMPGPEFNGPIGVSRLLNFQISFL